MGGWGVLWGCRLDEMLAEWGVECERCRVLVGEGFGSVGVQWMGLTGRGMDGTGRWLDGFD